MYTKGRSKTLGTSYLPFPFSIQRGTNKEANRRELGHEDARTKRNENLTSRFRFPPFSPSSLPASSLSSLANSINFQMSFLPCRALDFHFFLHRPPLVLLLLLLLLLLFLPLVIIWLTVYPRKTTEEQRLSRSCTCSCSSPRPLSAYLSNPSRDT